MATPLSKPVRRETVKDFSHPKRKIVITLAPGTDSRDDLIGMRLKGTRGHIVGRVVDIYRVLALWHGQKVAKAKKEARAAGIPWKRAKRAFLRANTI